MKDMKDIEQNAIQAAAFLKGLTNPDRLVILCKLAEFGECSVSQMKTKKKGTKNYDHENC
ncbi:MAG: hypothetical protein ACK4VI_05720 [Alphaproteobacteria bacterium]